MNQQIKQKLPNKILIDEKLAIKVIMDCRATPAHKFRTKLGFKKMISFQQWNNQC